LRYTFIFLLLVDAAIDCSPLDLIVVKMAQQQQPGQPPQQIPQQLWWQRQWGEPNYQMDDDDIGWPPGGEGSADEVEDEDEEVEEVDIPATDGEHGAIVDANSETDLMNMITSLSVFPTIPLPPVSAEIRTAFAPLPSSLPPLAPPSSSSSSSSASSPSSSVVPSTSSSLSAGVMNSSSSAPASSSSEWALVEVARAAAINAERQAASAREATPSFSFGSFGHYTPPAPVSFANPLSSHDGINNINNEDNLRLSSIVMVPSGSSSGLSSLFATSTSATSANGPSFSFASSPAPSSTLVHGSGGSNVGGSTDASFSFTSWYAPSTLSTTATTITASSTSMLLDDLIVDNDAAPGDEADILYSKGVILVIELSTQSTKSVMSMLRWHSNAALRAGGPSARAGQSSLVSRVYPFVEIYQQERYW
jgi:hypothetical protein